MRQPHTRLRRGDCATPRSPQTPKMVFSCDPLHHSRYAGEMTQGVAFQKLRATRPVTQRASNPLSRSVLLSSLHRFAARAQPHGNPGRLREAQDCWIAHSPRGSGGWSREGCCFALSLCCLRIATALRLAEKSLEMLGDLRLKCFKFSPVERSALCLFDEVIEVEFALLPTSAANEGLPRYGVLFKS